MRQLLTKPGIIYKSAVDVKWSVEILFTDANVNALLNNVVDLRGRFASFSAKFFTGVTNGFITAPRL